MGLDIFFYKRSNTNNHIERAMERFYGTIKESTPVSEVRQLANELGIADRLDIGEHEYNGTPYVTAHRSDTKEVGYMRKHNHLIPYFNYGGNCSNKVVERCEIEAFIDDAKEVLSHYGKDDFQEVAGELIPHEEGFFFGGYEYDEWYKQDLEEDIKILQGILENTDWNTDYIIMYCWW